MEGWGDRLKHQGEGEVGRRQNRPETEPVDRISSDWTLRLCGIQHCLLWTAFPWGSLYPLASLNLQAIECSSCCSDSSLSLLAISTSVCHSSLAAQILPGDTGFQQPNNNVLFKSTSLLSLLQRTKLNPTILGNLSYNPQSTWGVAFGISLDTKHSTNMHILSTTSQMAQQTFLVKIFQPNFTDSRSHRHCRIHSKFHHCLQ